MKGYTSKELCLIWLDSFLGLEYKHKQALYSDISEQKEIKSFIEENKDYILTKVGEQHYNTLLNSANNVYLNYVLECLQKRNIKAVTILSDEYPQALKDIPLPPLVLYLKGNAELLNDEIFAIVGSRRSLPAQINTAKYFSESLVSAGFTIVTGIAEGVDTAVLESALDKGGKVISVIAGGFDNIYPASNISLAKRIEQNGLLISENPPETVPKPYHFPIRNRIIAGLSVGTLVVSAGLKSGTMYTAEYAEEYSRLLFAVPYSIGVKSGEGCNKLIKFGAHLADCPEDILGMFNKIQEKEKVELNTEEQKIVKILADGEKHAEYICNKLEMPIYTLTPLLSGLEIKGVIVRNGGNIYGLKN